MDKDTRVNGKSMTDTMSDLYKNNSGAKKALQTITIDKKGDEKLLGCVSDLVEGWPWIHNGTLAHISKTNTIVSKQCIASVRSLIPYFFTNPTL